MGEFLGSQSLRIAYLSEAYLLAGRMDEAITQALRAHELCRAHQERGHQAWVHRLLGVIHSHREPLEVEPAEAHYRQALALAEELGMRSLQAHCHFGLGTL
jgi:tetratricopeptide (TPR) repeat protein